MKVSSFVVLSLLCSSLLYSQPIFKSYQADEVLTAEQCFDVVKTVWDELKKLSEAYHAEVAEKNEFESTSEYKARIQKSKDDYIGKIRKFYSENRLNSRTFSVWMNATLVKYDADNQTYGIKSTTEILIQPKKKHVIVSVPANKYLAITEKDIKGYRRAYIHLNTNPEFTWFVNKQTAQEAKSNESNIFFKVSFMFDIIYNDAADIIDLQIIPTKISLMNQGEKFTYWSEDIR